MVYPSLAGVARFSGPGVDLSSWAFHPSPVPLRRGTLNGLSHAGGGGPLQRDGGGHCCLGFSILPLRPSEGGHLRWCVAHYVLDIGEGRYDDIVHRWRGWPASAGRGWTCYFGLFILPLRPFRRGTFAVGFGFVLLYSYKGAPGAAPEVIVAYGKTHVRNFLSSSFNSEEEYQKTC